MPVDPKKRGMASVDPEIRRRNAVKGGSTRTEKTKLRGFANPNHPYYKRKNG